MNLTDPYTPPVIQDALLAESWHAKRMGKLPAYERVPHRRRVVEVYWRERNITRPILRVLKVVALIMAAAVFWRWV